MTVEHFKQRNAINRMQQEGGIDRLARYAHFLLDTVILLTGGGRQPANYQVVQDSQDVLNHHDDTWLVTETGTRDHCIGFAAAYERGCIRMLVVCGEFVLWPDRFYGEQLPPKPSGWDWNPPLEA